MEQAKFEQLKTQLQQYKDTSGSPLKINQQPKTETQLPKTEIQPQDIFGVSSPITIKPQNIIKSGVNVLSGLTKVVFDPISAVQNITETITGGVKAVERLFGAKPLKTESDQKFSSFVSYLKNRYGGIEQIKNTIENDPVGFALDLSILTGGGAKLAQFLGIEHSAEMLGKISQLTDPILGTVKGMTGILKGSAQLEKYLAGLVTRKGVTSIEEAFAAGKEGGASAEAFKAGLREKIPETQVLGEAETALGKLYEKRASQYSRQLNILKNKYPQELDLAPVFNAYNKSLEDFNISVNASGKINLSKSPLINDANKVQNVVNITKDYLNKGDATIGGLDIFKRQLQQFREINNPSLNKFIDNIINSAKNYLGKEIPGYTKLQETYTAQSEIINDIKKDLGIGSKVSIDTAYKKLLGAMRKDSEFKQALVAELEKAGAKNLIKEIAGLNLSEVLPENVFAYAFDLGSLLTIPATLIAGKPLLAIASVLEMMMTSPRLVGEIAYAFGWSAKAVENITGILNKFKVLGGVDALMKAGYITTQFPAEETKIQPTGGQTTIPIAPQE